MSENFTINECKDTVASIKGGGNFCNDLFSKTLYEIFEKEVINRYSQELIKPISNKIYNFLYPYIWMICIYNVLLFILILANFVLLLKLSWKTKMYYNNI